MLDKLSLAALLGLTALSAACATDTESALDAARASCEERHVAAGPDMDRCIAETAEAIQRARDLHDAPEPANPRPHYR